MTATIEVNRIDDVAITPAQAEVRIRVAAGPGAELRGRLVGPRCRYSSTVEVAYPLRPAGPNAVRVVIPEPNLWDPTAPFLYEGSVEAWRDGRLEARTTVRHGLRTLRLGPPGLRLNGRPFVLKGLALDRPSEEDLLRARQQGADTVLVPAGAADVCEVADRLGLFVLARLESPADLAGLRSIFLGQHPSALGVIVAPRLWQGEARPALDQALGQDVPAGFWGLEVRDPALGPRPGWAAFCAGDPDAAAGETSLPWFGLERGPGPKAGKTVMGAIAEA